MIKKRTLLFIGLGGVLLALLACSTSGWFAAPTATIDLPGALTALAPSPEVVMPTLDPKFIPTATPVPLVVSPDDVIRLWIAPYLPETLTTGLVAPFTLEMAADKDRAQLWLEVGTGGKPVTSLVYALTAPFPTLADEVSYDDLIQSWQGAPGGDFSSGHLYLTERTLSLFSAVWGEPQENFVRTVPQDDLLNTAWANQPAWALVPFDQLQPEWKVLAVDGLSPLWKNFDSAVYALSVPVSLYSANPDLIAPMVEVLRYHLPAALNRDSDKLTTVVLTGVTALVRATAYEMEEKGVLHPAEELGPMLQEADILHISNEVPFAEKCPPPKPVNSNLVFCSADKYMELLEYIGTDVVELTGDHFSDWGVAATLHTFDLYDAEGWQYYGGGRTPEQGRLPTTFEHNGNKIAFIGCNGKGGSYTPSVRGLPGAVDCDFNLIASEIARLKENGFLVIMTYQHHETYSFTPSPDLIEEFLLTAEFGADIVSGSQAHQPHGMTFHAGSTVMYGLGNLFFDQLLMGEDPSRALIARHIFYDGRHISTEIITIYFADFSKPLYLIGEGRERLLSQVFAASSWGDLPNP